MDLQKKSCWLFSSFFFLFLSSPPSLSACLKGDVDGNNTIDLTDALISAKTASGTSSNNYCLDADVNGDGRLGTPEQIVAMKAAARLWPGADYDGDGFSANDGDCNDNNPAIHPGATEICGDGIDQDCSGNDLTCPPLPNPLVGSWWTGSNSSATGEIMLLTFFSDGTYVHAQNGDSTNPKWIGLEYGTYFYDQQTGVLTHATVLDQNGEVGLSHTQGTVTISITGDSAQFNVENEESFPMVRARDGNSDSIIGGWWLGSSSTDVGGIMTITFYPNNTYIHVQNGDEVNASWIGLEYGTYTYNPQTGAFTATPLFDQNGEVGLSHPVGQETVHINDNILTYTDGSGNTPLFRVIDPPITPTTVSWTLVLPESK